MKDYIRICDVEKYYGSGTNVTKAVDRVSFTVDQGEFVGVMGASGSGKTTLLNMLSTIDSVTAGHIYYGDMDITELPEERLADFRKDNLGFVFQEYNLLDTLTIEENIMLAMTIRRKERSTIQEETEKMLRLLGIEEVRGQFPYEVSGGQKQRAAACRALITKPDIVLADEPTGALDSRASGRLLRLLGEVNREGQTILMVTHSIQAASHAGRVLFIKDGCVFHQIYRGSQSDEMMYKMISDALTVLQAEQTPEEAQA